MAKMTNEEKKAAKKAKCEAKKLAKLEKLEKKREKKRLQREAKKAKRAARLEKEKARKAAIKEKKRLAKEKMKTAKISQKKTNDKKPIVKTNVKTNDAIDIKVAAKTIKLAMAQIASQMVELDDVKRAKKAKSIRWMGYDVETKDNEVIVRFDVEKTKKIKIATDIASAKEKKERKPREKKTEVEVVEEKKVAIVDPEKNANIEDEPQEVEMVPAGDLYGQEGNVDGEVVNLDSDDEDDIDDDDDNDLGINNDPIADSRDEQDEDIIENRREYFGNLSDDGEMNID